MSKEMKGFQWEGRHKFYALLGLLNISLPWQIQAQEETAIISWREYPKKHALSLPKGPSSPEPCRRKGRSHFDARSVHGVREHGKRARTPLAAFFNIPLLWVHSKAACFMFQSNSLGNTFREYHPRFITVLFFSRSPLPIRERTKVRVGSPNSEWRLKNPPPQTWIEPSQLQPASSHAGFH